MSKESSPQLECALDVVTFVNGKWFENCYLAVNHRDAIIIDPGGRLDDICALVEQNQWRVHAIVNTHAHYDHIGAVAGLQERFEVPFYLHGADLHLLKRANLYRMLFEAGEAVRIPTVTHDIASLPATFEAGPFSISWISTPGHTEGSVCLLCQGFLFSGDTLMHNSIGRTDLPGGNKDKLLGSIRMLKDLPPETIVCGGHGPRTTIEAEFSEGARVWGLLQ